MKKSAIALAVAASLGVSAAAMAETTLYGSGRVSLVYDDPDSIDGEGEGPEGGGNWDIRNHSSRIGVRGSEDLGNGLSAIYQFEFGVDATDGGNFESNRPRVLGLKHDGFGSFTVGTQFTPYYNVVGVTDIFNAGGFDQFLGQGIRRSNSLVYISPDWYGFRFEGMTTFDGLEGNDGLEEWNFGLRYQNGPYFVGGTYLSDEFFNTGTWAIAAGAAFGAFAISAAYEDGEIASPTQLDDDGNTLVTDTTSWIVTGAYTFGNNIIRAAFNRADPDDGADVNSIGVGFQHNLSKRTRLWLEYFTNLNGADDAEEFIDELDNRERDTFSLGIRHDF